MVIYIYSSAKYGCDIPYRHHGVTTKKTLISTRLLIFVEKTYTLSILHAINCLLELHFRSLNYCIKYFYKTIL